MADPRTLAVYDAKANEYAKLTQGDVPHEILRDFIALIPKGGAVLDLGCGPGTASAHMRDAGLRPDPVDASQGMITLANQTYDLGARLASFDDVAGTAIYDGVWANFSLLHAPRVDFPRHLAAISAALRPAGILHIGLKTGTGSQRDAIDRLYTYVTVTELRSLLEDAGFLVAFTKEGVEKGMAGTMDPYVIMRAKKEV